VKSYKTKAQKLTDSMSHYNPKSFKSKQHKSKSAKDAKAKGWDSEDGSGPVDGPSSPFGGGKSDKGMSHAAKSSKKLFHKSEKAEPEAPAPEDDWSSGVGEVSRDDNMRR